MRSNHKKTNYKSTNFDEVGTIFKISSEVWPYAIIESKASWDQKNDEYRRRQIRFFKVRMPLENRQGEIIVIIEVSRHVINEIMTDKSNA